MHLTSHDFKRSKTNLALIRPDTTGTTEFLALNIEAKLQSTRRPRRTQRSLGEESGVNFELEEFASIPADVPIFEAIKKELDARVMEISGIKEKPRFLL